MVRPRSARCLQRTIAAVLAIGAPAVLMGPAAAQGAPEPYEDPPWADECQVRDFGEGEAPQPGSLDDDPLCIRYAKEDITVDDGGALEFLAAEPARVMAAVPACRYWQRDRWSVQMSAGTPAIVSWEGSYWWDRGAGLAGAVLRDFQLGGQPVGAHQVADLVEALDPDLAEVLRSYGDPGGGVGGAVDLGGSDPSCAAADDEPTPIAEQPDEPPAPTSPSDTVGAPGPTARASAPATLPITGAAPALGAAALALVAALAGRAALHRTSA